MAFPFKHSNKKLRMESVMLQDERDKMNRVFLTIEIRRYSSVYIKCFVFCKYLIYNETSIDLLYRSGIYTSKVLSKDFESMGINNSFWVQQKEELLDRDTDPENNTLANELERNSEMTDEFYSKVCRSLEMFSPEKSPGKIRVSISESNWSNEFILRLKESSSFVIKESKSDSEKLLSWEKVGLCSDHRRRSRTGV